MKTRVLRPLADARFVIGVVLVVASVAGVWALMSAARTTSPVWVATRVLVPGEEISAGDVRAVEVTLGESVGRYVAGGTSVVGSIITRVIPTGELIPTGAVSSAAAVDRTSVVVVSEAVLAAAIEPGQSVELWATAAATRDAAPRPRLLIADAVVSSVDAASGAVMSRGSAVELVIPRAAVSDVLRAQAAADAFAVVPVAVGQ